MSAHIVVRCDADVTEYGTCTRRASSKELHWEGARTELEQAGWRFRGSRRGNSIFVLCPFHAGTDRMRQRR